MVPPVVRDNELVGDLLLFRRQAGIERLERREQACVVVGAHFLELLPQVDALHCVHRSAVLPGGGNRLVERVRVFAHCRGHLLPLRLLRGRDFELGFQECEAPVHQLPGKHSLCRALMRPGLRYRRVRRRDLRQGGDQSGRGNPGEECCSKKRFISLIIVNLGHKTGSCPSSMTYAPANRGMPETARMTPI